MKCDSKGCPNKARYIVGKGKMKICTDCFDEYISNKDKSDFYKNNQVKKIKDSKKKDKMEYCYGCTWNDGIYESAHCLSCRRNPNSKLDDNWRLD